MARKMVAVVVDENAARLALAELRALLDRIKADHGADVFGADEQLLLDTLDGEGGDYMDVLRKLLSASLDAAAQADAIGERIDSLRTRKARFQSRAERYEDAAACALRTLGLPSLETEEATLSLRRGPAYLQIEDESFIPARFMKPPKPPEIDRAELRKWLGQDGNAMPGVRLVEGEAGASHQIRKV